MHLLRVEQILITFRGFIILHRCTQILVQWLRPTIYLCLRFQHFRNISMELGCVLCEEKNDL